MLNIFTIIIFLIGGLFITSRAWAVGYNKENSKPKNYVEEFIEDCMNNFRGLGWKRDT
ncbi:MAG: hypothetical protein AABY22_04755 [Nanoarchaeota archaeon]